MRANEFIVEALRELADRFKHVRLRYEEDYISNAHFIEVSPKYMEKNIEFKKNENYLISSFIEKFPDQTLSFITEDALVGLFKVDCEVKGNLYDLYYNLHESLYKKLIEFNFTFASKKDVDINITTTMKSYPLQSTTVHTNVTDKQIISITSASSLDECNLALAGDSNYAMAA